MRSSVTTDDSPSEQSSRRSPGWSSTALTSTSGSSPPDSARVTTLRHGCCRASSGGQQAGAHLLLDPRVVVGHALQLVVAEQVDARVADVRQHRLVIVLQQHRRRRGRHAAQVDGGRHFVGKAPVGEMEGALEAAAVDPQRRIDRMRPGQPRFLARGLADERLDRVDRDLRGDLTRDMTAHSIGDDEQAQVRPGAIGVLVGRATNARMRRSRPLDRHKKAESIWSGPSMRPQGASRPSPGLPGPPPRRSGDRRRPGAVPPVPGPPWPWSRRFPRPARPSGPAR